MIISLRGTNGSGKSTVIRRLMAKAGVRALYGALGPRLPEAYELELPKTTQKLYVLGPYLTECGGCDRIQPYDRIPELIEKYATRGHVLFEGIIVTSVYGKVGALLEKYKKDAVFLFLDTPLETCLFRIESRRGRDRDDRLIKNVGMKYKSAQSVRKRVETEGIMRAMVVNADDAPQAILKLVRA